MLDPFEVGPGWFRLNAALHLEVSTKCPASKRKRAVFTLTHLELNKGRAAMRLREKYLQQYELAVKHGMNKKIALQQLEQDAPLVASYVRSLP